MVLYYFSNQDLRHKHEKMKNRLILTFIFLLLITINSFSQNRSIDGYGNNESYPVRGAVGDVQIWSTAPGFSDGYAAPAGQNRMNTREISNLIFQQEGLINDPMGLSDYNFVWGQFIDHDITLVHNDDHDALNIQVPKFDPWMDPFGSGSAIIPMMRALHEEGTGTDINNPRKYPNSITAFIDGSNVYGSDEETALWLRAFVDGKLKTSQGELLPYNTITGEYEAPVDQNAPFMAMLPGESRWFVAGDIRANENVLLTAMHTTWVREHNYQCDKLRAANPNMTDEAIYQKARKIVNGEMQSIVYNEWLPAVGVQIDAYTGYDPEVNPQIMNIFSTAAYRYGHTTINSNIHRMDQFGHTMSMGNMTLAEAFFHSDVIRETEGIEPFLKGMCHQLEQAFDCKMIDDLRNALFGPPGAGGMDLAAINMMRGRERGLADYNSVRESFGLSAHQSFDQICSNPELVQQLYEVYEGNISNIDPWVGMLAENRLPGSLFGELVNSIMSVQFTALRNGDRFYFMNDDQLTAEEKETINNTVLSDIISRNSDMPTLSENVFYASPIPNEIRTITGVNNNLIKPEWGSRGTHLVHFVSSDFSDGISAPAGANRRNAREVSNIVFDQEEKNIPNKLGLSDYVYAWGQFIDHDISLTQNNNSESLLIEVPTFDPWFDPQGNGNVVIPMARSAFDPSTGTSPENPRKFKNEITAFIDASNVYGSEEARSNWLRTFEDGKLKTSDGNLLPYNTYDGSYEDNIDQNAPGMDHPIIPQDGKWFIAGDRRANENPLLTSIHTLFVREHNRLCDEILEAHPNWFDDQIYHQARRIVIGAIESIVFYEWLPAMGVEMDPYTGYKPNVNPQIMNVFAAAAYRYGHTTINSKLFRIDENCQDHENGHAFLKYAFFNPEMIREVNGIEPYLTGMVNQQQQDLDCFIIDDLRNFLFGAPGSGGMDLAAINLMRGRDRGLPDYNTVREQFGFAKKQSFATLSEDVILNQKLYQAYSDINDIDVWAGILAEDHVEGAMFGDLGIYIIMEQFIALRDGDRFYFENDPGLSNEDILNLKATRLSDIIRRNTNIECLPNDEVFYYNPITDTEETSLAQTQLKASPNPTQGYVQLEIESNNPEEINLTVYNTLGQLIQQSQISLFEGSNTVELNLTGMANGLYSVIIDNGNQKVLSKIIKQ